MKNLTITLVCVLALNTFASTSRQEIIDNQARIINNQRTIIDTQEKIIQQNAQSLENQKEIIENQKVAEQQRKDAAAAQKEQTRQITLRQDAIIKGGDVPVVSEKILYVYGRSVKLANNAGSYRIPGNLKNVASKWNEGDIVDVYDNSANDSYCTVRLHNVTKNSSTVAKNEK